MPMTYWFDLCEYVESLTDSQLRKCLYRAQKTGNAVEVNIYRNELETR
jgi:hypothetical protein